MISDTLKWKRGRRADTDVAERMIYDSHCGRYRIIRSKLNGYGLRWQAIRVGAAGSVLLGTCKSRKAAERKCGA